MKLTPVGFFMLFSCVALACGQKELEAISPATQRVTCVERWRKDQILVIAERDCIPCGKLLDRMRKEMRDRELKKVEMLWIDANPLSCLETSQRFSEFGSVECVNKRELEEKWQINSTPVVFWIKEGQQRVQKGALEPKTELPW